jgi:hypothetical protein
MFHFLGLLWWLVRVRLVLAILVLASLAMAHCWLTHRSRSFPLDERRSELADEVARKLAESLPVPPAGRPTLLVTRFDHDPTGALTEAVRRAIDRVDRYTVQPPTFMEELLRRCGWSEKPLPPERARSLAVGGLSGEYLLAGRVRKLSARRDADEAALEAVFMPVGAADKGIPLAVEVVHDYTAPANRTSIEAYPWPARLVTWLIFTLLLPVLAAPLITRGLERKSNAVNLAIWLGLTLIGAAAAFAMIGFRLDTPASALLLIAALAGALSYNWLVLAKLEELSA